MRKVRLRSCHLLIRTHVNLKIYILLCVLHKSCPKSIHLVLVLSHLTNPSISELDKIVVRLWGFHLLVSYMGSLGYVMGDGGLEELFMLQILSSI